VNINQHGGKKGRRARGLVWRRGEEENRITESSNEKFTKEMSKQEATFMIQRDERIRIMGYVVFVLLILRLDRFMRFTEYSCSPWKN
jgi:hypothetical protein